jgi:hypothetical protein
VHVDVPLPMTLLIRATFGAREQTLNDAVAFFDGLGAEDEHRTGVVFTTELLDRFIESYRTVENQGEQLRLRVKQANVTEIFASETLQPERRYLKLFTLNVKFDGIRRTIRNGTFEKSLYLSHDIELTGVVMIDVELAEIVDRRERVNRLMMERQ